MDEISKSAKTIWEEEIERARSMSISEKFLAGASLFEEACEVARREIRGLNPKWTDEQVAAELECRLEPERRAKEAALILCSTP